MNRDNSINVNYFGEIFSTSGYATAARAYVHALHEVGVRVSTAGLGRPDQCSDDLVRSLAGRSADADFHIVHAIPTFWPRWTYRTRNVIAVTVWEADPIPSAWATPLSRAIDVWVPCEFNVSGFQRVLGKAPYVLPYALPELKRAPNAAPGEAQFGLSPTDFVFYSIFDWQHRKNPEGTIQAFLHAFPNECEAILFLKTIGRAAREATDLLEEIRARTHSRGRVLLRCEPFSDDMIGALHQRGDCYLSLHRGEGWGYPLFEAAARGNPVVASAQGGPLDFLDPNLHSFVACGEQTVEKPYFLFTPEMKWSEPDVHDAARLLRWTFEHRAKARDNAQVAAATLRSKYSLTSVGEAAKARLTQLRAARV